VPGAAARDGSIAVSVFPNPSEGRFNVSILNYGGSDNFSISVYDLQGKSIFTNRIMIDDFAETSFSLAHAAKGIYVLKVTGSRVNVSKPIIII